MDKLHQFLKDKLLKYEFIMWKSCPPISFIFSIVCMRRIKSVCVLSGFEDASQKAEFLAASGKQHKIPLFEPCPASKMLEMLSLTSA